MASGVSPRLDNPVLDSDVENRSSLTSIEEEDSESSDYSSGPLTLHRSLDSFFHDSEAKPKPLPQERLFQKVLDEHNELKREVAILKLRNWKLEQVVQNLHSLVISMAYAPPPPQFYRPAGPQYFPRATNLTSDYYRPNNMSPPPFYQSGYESPPRPDSPTDFSHQN